jgi:hypothetical protein
MPSPVSRQCDSQWLRGSIKQKAVQCLREVPQARGVSRKAVSQTLNGQKWTDIQTAPATSLLTLASNNKI